MTGSGFSLVQLSDTHLFAGGDGELAGVNTRASLRRVLAMLREQGLDGHDLVVSGDLVHDESEQGYRELGAMLAAAAPRVWFLPGNHDDPALMTAVLPGQAVTTSRAIDYGDWRILLCSSFAAGQVSGRLDSATLDWLRTQLRQPGPAHFLLFLHHPPVSVGSRWLDGLALDNAGDLLGLCADQRLRAVAFGHIHQEYDADHGGVRMLGVPSTCVQFLPGSDDFALEAAAPGCRLIHCLPDGRLQTRVLRVQPD